MAGLRFEGREAKTQNKAVSRRILIGAGMLVGFATMHLWVQGQDPTKGSRDPAAWGGDHVGEGHPEYMTGGECLFCHGKTVGANWQKNSHALSIRLPGEESAEAKALAPFLNEGAQLDYLLGGDRVVRYLRRGKGYGKADLHSHRWNPHARTLVQGKAGWESQTFGKNCAGCHATAVDSNSQSFSSLGIDCYACHGEMNPGHTDDPALMLLSPKGRDSARVITSICASCHLRTGQSRSTGRPYPNHFVPGDNLFRDFEVSFDQNLIKALNPSDRHILENVRGVVLDGRESPTCLSCHDVHRSSMSRHEKLDKNSKLCATCHETKSGKWTVKTYQVHSNVCGY